MVEHRLERDGRLIPALILGGFIAWALLQSPSFPVAGTGETTPSPINAADVAWLLTASGLVLLMTPGLAFFYGGMVGRKNIISTMLQSFVCLGVVSLLWVFVGFSLAFGDSIGGLIGDPRTYFMFDGVGFAAEPSLAAGIPLLLFAMFQLKFAVITPALITGSFAERVRFSSYLVFMCFFTLCVYCPLAHWTWHPQGFLRQMGVLDFAGGTVVHISAGLAALAGAVFLGPRIIHSKIKMQSTAHTPANIPYVVLGTGMLWFGWFGFNAGSALGANESAVNAFATTHIASAAGMLAWIFLDRARGKKISTLGACIGSVVGLVAITPAAGFITIAQSAALGAIASMISNVAVHWTSKTGIDDTLDVFPCHGLGGIVGMLATGILAKDVGLVFGHSDTFVAHVIGLGVVCVYVFLVSLTLFWITHTLVPMRVSPEQEAMGLDLDQHDETVLTDGLACGENAA